MKSLITWFIDNTVATNLMTWIFVIGGLVAFYTVQQEEFPNIETDTISITVPYLGASPVEVERAVCVRIEEAVEGGEGIKRIRSTASEGMCSVAVELVKGSNKARILNQIKSKIDAIDSFPDETEQPVVSEVTISTKVMDLMVSGDADERTLKELAEHIRSDLLELNGITQVSLSYARPYEISVEVSEQSLRRFGLSLKQVGDAIGDNSVDLPGGAIKTADGEILLRTAMEAHTGQEFEQIVVLTREDGTQVKLGDVATVVDGFKDTDLRASFDGSPAVAVIIRKTGQEDVLLMADKVKAYLEDLRPSLPEGITVTVWDDESQDLVDRLAVLSDNAFSGLILVVLVLALFLRFRLALWVAIGLPIALLGAVMVFPFAGVTISTVSVMGIILVLGILVDDAIVVGERVYAHLEEGKDPRQAAIDGTYEVSVPVIFGVLTTMVAFLPIMVNSTDLGSLFGGIGVTAILALFFSLIESQAILPLHLSHASISKETKGKRSFADRWRSFQDIFSGWLLRMAQDVYRPFLEKALLWRYVAACSAIATVIIVVALFASGRVVFQFFPSVEGTRMYATLSMPEGTPVETTEKAVRQLLAGSKLVQQEVDADLLDGEEGLFQHTLASIGKKIGKGSMDFGSAGGSHIAEVGVALNLPPDHTGTSPAQYAARWRELTGPVADAVELSFNASSFDLGKPIDVRVVGDDLEQLKQAAALIRTALTSYDGVYDIADTFRGGKQEVRLKLLPEARNLGLSTEDMARQVRRAFYGQEVQRIQRGREDVKVMVRYPEDERRSLGDLELMRIRTADGVEVPFSAVAQVSLGSGFSDIVRRDGKRVINVQAEVDRVIITPEEILKSLERDVLPQIQSRFPKVEFGRAGEAEESAEAMRGFAIVGAFSMFLIYALLAIPLKSYMQPLVIMSVIPFGAMGAIFGHYIMGEPIVFFSLLGMMALSGVVVNSSLVLVDSVNRRRDQGETAESAVAHAAVSRFRPIVLTSVTTFAGLVPLIMNSNLSTGLFVPMAISLGFGVLFATLITLVLVPCFYLILEDLLNWVSARVSQMTLVLKGE
ncbi:MAG: efflux RND transporter permease subunit [Pseudomonadales bacterium]